MQTAGKVIEKLLEVSGENENGYWVRGGFVLLTADDRGETLCFQVNGTERCEIVRQINVGDAIFVTWRPKCRKIEDKWFTNLVCYDIANIEKGGARVTQ